MKLRHGLFVLFASGLAIACNTVGPAPMVDTSAQIAASMAATDRTERETARDEGRNPVPLLKLSGIKPGDTVADFGAGGGYFSKLLSGVVGDEGKVIVQNPPTWVEKFKSVAPRLEALQAARANTDVLTAGFDATGIAPGSLDAATMMLVYHDTANLDVDRAKMNAEIYASLKKGGIYLVTDHHAVSGTATAETDTLHRIDAQTVRDEIEAAGFTLETSSDALHFADDDRSKNVFDPTIRGKTDRFVYLFRK